MKPKPKFRFQGFILEILSIFIAISAAFWLDDWNRIRLERKEEVKILKELKNGLISDITDMESNMEGHLLSIRSSINLVKFIDGSLDSTDNVLGDFHQALIDYTFTPNTGAYETLKSRGLGLISNDSLRLGIISLYDFDFPAMVQMEENEDAFEFNKNYSPVLIKRLSDMKLEFWRESNRLRSAGYPPNYKGKADVELKLITDRMIHNRNIISGFYRRKSEKARELIDQIEEELKSLE